MAKLIWDEIGSREFEIGVDRGVFFPPEGVGVPWNGLISVKEAPSGSDVSEGYFNGEKYQRRRAVEGFAGTIEALTYPDEFIPYDGFSGLAGQQPRRFFGFSYRTFIGNDTQGTKYGYKIHLVYNAKVSPGGKSYETQTDSSDPSAFSWDFTTIPVVLNGRAFSHLVIDASKAHPWTVEAVENLIYGSDDTVSTMPDPAEILEVFEANAILRVVDNGDGTWTATGPDSAIQMIDDSTFAISWDSALYIDDKTYYISSL